MPLDDDVTLLLRAGGALVVVTAAITRYVLGLAAGSARAAWSRRAGRGAAGW
jgi:hypothetical protein